MKFVPFDGMNSHPEDHEGEYKTMPSFVNPQTQTVTVCMELDEEEKKQLQETGKLFLTILHQGRPIQPIGNSLLNPFKKKEDGGE